MSEYCNRCGLPHDGDCLRKQPARHIVMFSGGIGSWASAYRIIEQHGPDHVTLLFCDVGGPRTSGHMGEDEDCYRFIADATAQLGARLVTLNTGEDIWATYKRRRMIGSSRIAPCSTELKQKPARQWLAKNATTDDTIVIGIDWTETHRIPAIQAAYAPHPVVFPMAEKPYLDKDDMIALARENGLEPPRMYAAKYPHANCGGFCCRAGHAQFRLLLRENRDRFLYHEGKEQELRDHLGKDVAVLRDHRAGGVPLTLKTFRERIDFDQQIELFDADDWGGCACFTEQETP